MAERKRWERKKKPSPEYRLTPSERAKIYYLAKKRANKVLRRKVRDQSYADGNTVLFNSIGIAGEVCWARYLCVPWYQNSSSIHGDHHRLGDLQDRTGAWVEVKTSRNPRMVRIPPSTGRTWGYLAASWWNPTSKTLRLMGIAPQTMAMVLSVEKDVKRKNGRTTRVLELEASSLPSADSIFADYGRTHHPSGGEGLNCPWCIMGPWYCGESSCEEQTARRGLEINDLFEKWQEYQGLRSRPHDKKEK